MITRKHTRKNFLRLGLAATATAGLPRFAGAQETYPDKPVRGASSPMGRAAPSTWSRALSPSI
jgi:hypothetical protein